MPAVQLTRLKKQLDELTAHFSEPESFFTCLRALFEQYGDLTYRTGQALKPVSLLPGYRVSRLVMKQLELSLAPFCAAYPQESLTIADSLWQDKFFEPRQLACFMLGQTALDPLQEVLTRLEHWSMDAEDNSLLSTLLDQGSQRLRREAPDRWLDVLHDWMGSSNLAMRQHALMALLPFIQDREFENLPAVFSLVSPDLQQNAVDLPADLLKVLNALARRSPVETGYILRQVLATSNEAAFHRLVRRCLSAFPADIQVRLKTALQAQSSSSNHD
jgi:hypothetical protein